MGREGVGVRGVRGVAGREGDGLEGEAAPSMLSQGKTMDIAELHDLTHSYAATSQLAGVDPKTVRRTPGAPRARNGAAGRGS